MQKNYNKINKMGFLNINLLNKFLLIVFLVSLKLKIKKAFHYTVQCVNSVSSEKVWKRIPEKLFSNFSAA